MAASTKNPTLNDQSVDANERPLKQDLTNVGSLKNEKKKRRAKNGWWWWYL